MRPDLVVLNRDEARTLIPGTSDADDLHRVSASASAVGRGGHRARRRDGAAERAGRRGPRAETARRRSTAPAPGDAFAAALIDSLRRSPWPPAARALDAALAAASELATAVAQAPGAQGRVAGEPDDGLSAMTVAALLIADEVRAALDGGRPVVALESSLIAQGLPVPHNLETALAAEAAVRESGAVPATTALEDGRLVIGAESRAP